MAQIFDDHFNVMEIAQTYSMTIGVVAVSVFSAFLYSLLNDFLQSFLKRPAHFLPFKLSQLVKPNKVNIPVVELIENGNYRELLARGSKQVSCEC